MTSFRFLAIVLLLAAGSLQAQVSGTRVQPQARAETVAPSVLLQQHFRANDATYEVSLPDGWQQVGEATLDYGLFSGTRTQAESFAVGMEQVFSNPAMLRAQLPGYSVILPPAQLVLKGHLLAPPLAPLQIVTILLPKLAGGPRGAIQNVRVTYTIPVNMRYRLQRNANRVSVHVHAGLRSRLRIAGVPGPAQRELPAVTVWDSNQ
jgi:hypothetical protein